MLCLRLQVAAGRHGGNQRQRAGGVQAGAGCTLDEVEREIASALSSCRRHVVRGPLWIRARQNAVNRGLSYLRGWRVDDAPYEPFTLVNQAVEAAKRGQATRGQASFINACLRRFLRERDALVAATDGDPVARWNHPAWWIRRLQQDYPADWERILQANNAHAPMALRVNQQKCTLAQYQQALAAIIFEFSVIRADADGNDRLVDGSQPGRCENVTALMAVANQPGCIGSAAVDHKPSTATGRV